MHQVVLALSIQLLLLSDTVFAAATPVQFSELACSSTKEFVTSLEFLRKNKQLNMAEPDARKLAEEIAKGCDGAGRRFVSISATLLKAGLAASDAIAQGKAFALRTDQESRAFIGVFRTAFSEEGLDLDLGNSIAMARNLSLEFGGESLWAYGDFKRVADLCMGKKGFDMPKGECAKIAERIAKNSIRGTSGAEFSRAFYFLRSKYKAPSMTNSQAIEYAEKLTLAGPDAIDNFITGFRYAVGRKGLNVTVADAFQFAERMALTVPAKN